MKGFVQGSLWGLVLGGAGLSVVSLVNEQPTYVSGPDAPEVVAPQFEVTAPSPPEPLDVNEDGSPVFTPVDPLDEVADTAPEVATDPVILPQTAEVAEAASSPETPSDAGLPDEAEAPTPPRVEAELQEPAPQADALELDTTPAETPVESNTDESAETETVTLTPEADTQTAQEPETQPAPVLETADVVDDADAPAAQIEQEVISEAPTGTTEETGSADEQADAEPESQPAPVLETADAVDDVQAPATPTDQEVISEAPTDPVELPVVDEEQVDAQQVTVAEALPQADTTVRINRPGDDDEQPQIETTEAAPEAESLPDDAPALLRHAAPFDAMGAASRISIVLVDEGTMPDAVNAVADLGFVPTVAVDPLSAGSTQLAAAYRDAGIEVALQAMLPNGAQPADVEIAFEAALDTVPEVAMLFSDGTAAMQDRAVTGQVMQVLAADGLGFVTVQRGLSNAVRAAEQAGVPAATILRDIDGDDEDVRAITRGLDQAAFRARQTGEAILLGRVRPDTLEALAAWAAELDQETLAIAPVSAILLAQE